MKQDKYNIVSLFSGAGGLDLGFRGDFNYLSKHYKKLNFNTIFANDIDKNACLTFKKNFKKEIVCEDVNHLLQNNFEFGKTDIVIGGFPCQDFSLAGKRLGFDSQRGVLYKSMCQVIEKTKPMLFVAENVKGILNIDNGNAIKQIISEFQELGYNIGYKLFSVADFGVPQKRERVIIIGTKKDILPVFDFSLIKPTERVMVGKAIEDLEFAEENKDNNHVWSTAKKNKGQGNTVINKNDFAPTMRAEHHGNIEFHWNGDRRLSAREAARIQGFPDDFIFYPSTSSAYKQVGNAVPPVFAWHIANAIENFIKNHNGKN